MQPQLSVLGHGILKGLETAAGPPMLKFAVVQPAQPCSASSCSLPAAAFSAEHLREKVGPLLPAACQLHRAGNVILYTPALGNNSLHGKNSPRMHHCKVHLQLVDI